LVSGVRGSVAESGEETELRVGVPTKLVEAVRDMGVEGSLGDDGAAGLLVMFMEAVRAAMSAAEMPDEDMTMPEVRRSM
jgi:hypothetical protein